MDRILVCTLMLLILFPEMVLARNTVRSLSSDHGLTAIAEHEANNDRSDTIKFRVLSASEDGYVDFPLTPDNRVRSPSPEQIADASENGSSTDAEGDDNRDSDDDSDSDDDADKGNDALTPAER